MKKIIQKVLLVLFSGFLLVGCTVETTVKGKVTNKDTSEVVANAKVTITALEKTYETYSDEEGNYSIKAILSIFDKVPIKIEHENYYENTSEIMISYNYRNKDYIYNVMLDSIDIVKEYGSVSGKIKTLINNNSIDFESVPTKVTINDNEINVSSAGVFTSDKVEVTDKTIITVEVNGYAMNSKNVQVKKGENTEVEIIIVKNDLTEIFDSNKFQEFDIKDGKINFTSNSFKDVNGNNYNGKVIVEATLNQVTNHFGLESFPGDFTGVREDGNTAFIESYGFYNIELKDESGNKLNLKNGTTATLTFPADPNLTHDQDTIPLWYYNTELGSWIEEGIATYDPVKNVYIGEVSHFSLWNISKPKPKSDTYVKGIVVDQDNKIIPGALIIASTSSWVNKIHANSKGEFIIKILPNENVRIRASIFTKTSSGIHVEVPEGNTYNLFKKLKLIEFSSSDYKKAYINGRFIFVGLPNTLENKSIHMMVNNKYYNIENNTFSIPEVYIKRASDTKLVFSITLMIEHNEKDEDFPWGKEKEIEIFVPANYGPATFNIGTIRLYYNDDSWTAIDPV